MTLPLLHTLPTPLRLVVTFLVLAMLVTVCLGEALVLHDNRMADGKPLLGTRDLQIRFTGGYQNLLEARVQNEMRQYLASSEEVALLVDWARNGAPEPEFHRSIAVLIEERCIRCHHNGGQAAFRPLVSYDSVREMAIAPPRPLTSRQLLVTKVHLIGIGILLAVASLFFSMSGASAGVQVVFSVAGFVGLAVDFASWWLMRLDIAFAWGRLLGNTLMLTSFFGMCFAALFATWRAWPGDSAR